MFVDGAGFTRSLQRADSKFMHNHHCPCRVPLERNQSTRALAETLDGGFSLAKKSFGWRAFGFGYSGFDLVLKCWHLSAFLDFRYPVESPPTRQLPANPQSGTQPCQCFNDCPEPPVFSNSSLSRPPRL